MWYTGSGLNDNENIIQPGDYMAFIGLHQLQWNQFQ